MQFEEKDIRKEYLQIVSKLKDINIFTGSKTDFLIKELGIKNKNTKKHMAAFNLIEKNKNAVFQDGRIIWRDDTNQLEGINLSQDMAKIANRNAKKAKSGEEFLTKTTLDFVMLDLKQLSKENKTNIEEIRKNPNHSNIIDDIIRKLGGIPQSEVLTKTAKRNYKKKIKNHKQANSNQKDYFS